MVGTEPEDQEYPVASRPWVARVPDQLARHGIPEILAVGLLDFHDNSMDTVDRDDVRPGVLREVPFRLSINFVRLQKDLKVREECITTGFFRLGLGDLPALWIVGVRVPILLPRGFWCRQRRGLAIMGYGASQN